jgi:hypothetical protein
LWGRPDECGSRIDHAAYGRKRSKKWRPALWQRINAEAPGAFVPTIDDLGEKTQLEASLSGLNFQRP